jgi:hypothetical protein
MAGSSPVVPASASAVGEQLTDYREASVVHHFVKL